MGKFVFVFDGLKYQLSLEAFGCDFIFLPSGVVLEIDSWYEIEGIISFLARSTRVLILKPGCTMCKAEWVPQLPLNLG